MPIVKLNKEMREEVARDCIVGGWSYSKCAEYYNISKRTVGRCVAEYKARKESNLRYNDGRKKYAWKPKKKLKPCGTDAAYQRHKRNGEYPCSACLAAHAEGVRKSREKKMNAQTIEEQAA